MPLKLVPPKPGRSSYWRVRGTHRGISVDRTTGIAAGERRAESRAQAFLERWRDQIERGELTGKPALTFDAAASAFILAGGEDRFLDPILDHFGTKLLAADVDQAMVDHAAAKLYPHATPATRNRQVYTPICAVLRHNGVTLNLKRPKGAQGRRREAWLMPDEFERVAAAAADIDSQLAAMMILACYTGLRLGEILGLRWADLDLEERTAVVRKTKNGDPRVAYLPRRATAVLGALRPAAMPGSARVFRFTRNQHLNDLAHRAYELAEVSCADAPFHILRHSWATWMVRLGADLVATKAWRSETAARGYTHFVVSEEARKADALPGANAAVALVKTATATSGA